MLELPKNDLKQSYGLTAKSAFSKAPGSSAAVNQIRDLWTSTPSGAPGTSSSNKQKVCLSFFDVPFCLLLLARLAQ
jgi:hypothetical protein